MKSIVLNPPFFKRKFEQTRIRVEYIETGHSGKITQIDKENRGERINNEWNQDQSLPIVLI